MAGLSLFLRSQQTGEVKPVEVSPDATVDDVRAAADLAQSSCLFYQDKLLRLEDQVADTGVSNQGTLEYSVMYRFELDEEGSQGLGFDRVEEGVDVTRRKQAEGAQWFGTVFGTPLISYAEWYIKVQGTCSGGAGVRVGIVKDEGKNADEPIQSTGDLNLDWWNEGTINTTVPEGQAKPARTFIDPETMGQSDLKFSGGGQLLGFKWAPEPDGPILELSVNKKSIVKVGPWPKDVRFVPAISLHCEMDKCRVLSSW